LWVGGEEEEGVKAKSSQVPNMFSKEFPIAPHFYPIYACQMLSSFHLYTWAKERELYT
jgi:hypothetical protein